jgi:hypothetical protein
MRLKSIALIKKPLSPVLINANPPAVPRLFAGESLGLFHFPSHMQICDQDLLRSFILHSLSLRLHWSCVVLVFLLLLISIHPLQIVVDAGNLLWNMS